VRLIPKMERVQVKKKCLVLLTVAASLSVASSSFAAMAGANTVNSAAIVDGSIATVDIANAAVTGAKIATGTITGTQLAAGAVTDAKITDVSMAKVTGLTAAIAAKADLSALNATNSLLAGKAAINHTHLLGNVTIVATEGGEYVSPVDAMNDLNNWCGVPSSTNPCLLKLMPGVYNLGNSSLVLPAFVSISGSGRESTYINSNGVWTLKTAGIGSSEVSSVSLGGTNQSSGNSRYGTVLLENNVRLSDVTVNHSSTESGAGTSYGVCVQNASVDMANVEVNVNSTAASQGIYLSANSASNLSANLNNVTVSADCGFECSGVYFDGFPKKVTMGNMNVSATTKSTVSGQAVRGIALFNYSAAGRGAYELNNLQISVNGGGYTQGLLVYGNNDATLRNSLITATNGNGGYTYGLLAGETYAGMKGVVSASNSSFNVDASGLAIYLNSSLETIKVANSMIAGGVARMGGTLDCINNFDSNLAPFVCPAN